MIIDINLLKRLGKRFGVFPISLGPPPLQAALQKPDVVFIKAPAGIEPAFTGGGYQWDDEINGYRFGNQKLFLTHDGTTIWTFKDVLFRGLGLDSVQKWTSGDDEYPMGKANAFFIVYGKLTGQDLGEGATAGDNVPDGETEPGDGGGVAMADDENAPPFSKQDIQKMLNGEFPAETPTAGPKASMDTAVPDEPSSPMAGPPPSRLAKGNPPAGTGSEAEKIIATLYKRAKINPKLKLSKQNPIRIHSDDIIDLYKRAKTMPPEEGEKLIAFLKSGAIQPLEEGKIPKSQLNGLLEHIVSGIVDEVEKAKQKAKAKKKVGKSVSKPASEPSESEEPSHSQMDWEPSAEKKPQYYDEDPEKPDYGKWVVQVANKLWKDPMDIWDGKRNRVSWQLIKVIPHETGEYYQLGKEKTVSLSRSFVRRNNKWYYLNPDPKNRHWVELGKEHPMDEPSIEQEATLDEMTTTAAAGPYSIPGAFGKKMGNRKGHIEVLGYKMTPQGEEEYKRPADKLYEAIKKNIKEMIREGTRTKTCPHCNMMAVNGVWTHEQGCPASKKRVKETAMGDLGPKFAAAQQHHDDHFFDGVPEDDIMIDCEKCGEPESARITKKGSKGSNWWWEAVCDKCGQTFGNDNF